jgi:hypothetical protein
MLLADSLGYEDLVASVDDAFPPEVDFVISALEAGPRPLTDRHRHKRMRYRVRAMLRLYSDGQNASPVLLYTRTISSRAVGILTARQLPLSHGGVILIPRPQGGIEQISCSVLRCGPATPKWYEGAIHFNRPQDCFEVEGLACPDA